MAAVTSQRPGVRSLGNTVELWPRHPFPPGRSPSRDSHGGSVFSVFIKEGGISLALIRAP